MNEKRVVSRKLAVAMGIISVVLLVSLVGTIVVYSLMMIGKNNEISSLNVERADLQSELTDLNNTVNLAKSEQWFTNDNLAIMPNSEFNMLHPVDYAGYISVQVQSSTTNTTYVQVNYNSHGLNYTNKVEVDAPGTAVFPVLPSQDLELTFGRPNPYEQENITITVIYHY